MLQGLIEAPFECANSPGLSDNVPFLDLTLLRDRI